jgi:hypothetical protein
LLLWAESFFTLIEKHLYPFISNQFCEVDSVDRTVKLRARVDHETYSKIEEAMREYRGVLEDLLEYGLKNYQHICEAQG